MAMNVTIPGGGARKEGIFPPQVIRREVQLPPARIEPSTPAWERPAPRAPQVNPVYTKGVNLDLTV